MFDSPVLSAFARVIDNLKDTLNNKNS